ncbi:hypothetical protein [Nocardiopsis sp. LOL_012]|uniref:hypothetical protein n=1 Tax=Nocardiopsis sp. LOL_012 TaxID=3345409 RepID=UPI003A874574
MAVRFVEPLAATAALAESARERTVIVIACRLSTVAAADRITVPDGGPSPNSGSMTNSWLPTASPGSGATGAPRRDGGFPGGRNTAEPVPSRSSLPCPEAGGCDLSGPPPGTADCDVTENGYRFQAGFRDAVLRAKRPRSAPGAAGGLLFKGEKENNFLLYFRWLSVKAILFFCGSS